MASAAAPLPEPAGSKPRAEESSTPDLLLRIEDIEDQAAGQARARRSWSRFLSVKIPILGALLYVSGRYDLLPIAALMALGAGYGLVRRWLRLRALRVEHEEVVGRLEARGMRRDDG